MNLGTPTTLFNIVIVRLGGETGIKSAWTRRTYEKRLIHNMKATLKHWNVPYDAVIRQQGRIYIKTCQPQKASERLTKVFGISSLSPASQTTSELEDLAAKSLLLVKRRFQKQNRFAVKCKRVGTHSYTSRDICRHIGHQILEAFPKLQLRVNLANPDVTIGIEIRENLAFIFTDTIPAPDGFPVGTQRKTIALIKPDMYSPVACWLTMKRGCPSMPVHFNEDKDRDAIKQVRQICKALFEWSIGCTTKVHTISHSTNIAILTQRCPPHMLGIINKRLIYRLAARIAEKEKAEAIVTGETIGEKPYQTLRHFKLQDQASQDYPIHRPLIGLDNAEIRNLAGEIGIEETLPRKTEKDEVEKPIEDVLPTLEEVEAVENRLNMQKMIRDTLLRLKTTTI